MSQKIKVRTDEIITALAERYPSTFTTIPEEIRPLKHKLLLDIIKEIRPARAAMGMLIIALKTYRSRPRYLIALSLGKRRRDLRGHKVERVTLEERQEARSQLIEQGIWTDHLESKFIYATKTLL